VAAGRLWALSRAVASVDSAVAVELLHVRAVHDFGEAAATAAAAAAPEAEVAAAASRMEPESGVGREAGDGLQQKKSAAAAAAAAATAEEVGAARMAWRRWRGRLAAMVLRVAAGPAASMDAAAYPDADCVMSAPGINASDGSPVMTANDAGERRVASEGEAAGLLRRMAEAEAAIAAVRYQVQVAGVNGGR
jgi:hypothetical protein